MITCKRIRELLDSRGKRWEDLGHYLGLHPRHVRRMLAKRPKAVPYDTIMRISEFFRAPVELIDPEIRTFGRGIHRFELADLDVLADFHAQLRYCRGCLTITRGLDSYLQSLPMSRWRWSEWLGNPGWDDRLANATQYIDQVTRARQGGDFLHRIVTPAALFRGAARQEPGWIEDVIGEMDRYDLRTSLGIVDDWERLDRRIERLIPVDLGRWEKVSFLEERCRPARRSLMLVRGSTERYAIVYNPDTVEGLYQEVEKLVNVHTAAEFPRSSNAKRNSLLQANAVTKRQLDCILRGRPLPS